MTLTQTALWTKRAVVLVSITLFLVISAKVGYTIWYNYQLAHLPKPTQTVDEKFGILPRLDFPPEQVSTSNYSYSLDTPTGDFPSSLPKTMNIYFIPQVGISLLAPDRSKQLALDLSFPAGPQILSPTSYQFSDNNGGGILIDLPTGNFHFQRAVASASATPKATFTENSDELIADFKAFLIDHKLMTDDIKDGQFKVTFDATSSATSTEATVSARPINLNDTPIITGTEHGLIRAKVIPDTDPLKRYIQFDYIRWIIDSSTFATYSLKDPKQAFQELQSGQGHVVIQPLKPSVSITDVSVAYYESDNYSPYLQPVYVFEGPHYRALVQAASNTQ